MIKWNGHLMDAIVFDIANWGGKLAFILFVFSLSHFYAYLIGGLGLIKFVADQLILWKEHKLLLQAQEEYKKAIHAALDSHEQSKQVMSTFDDISEIGEIDEEDLPPPPKKDYIQ